MATKADFTAHLPRLVDDLMRHLSRYQVPQDALDWFKQMSIFNQWECNIVLMAIDLHDKQKMTQNLLHNTANGKLNRGLSVIDSASILLDHPISPSSDDYAQLATLGWLTELLQAFFLVADDIMDDSHTRRGAPCWYRMPKVGMIAINDAFMLESSIYSLLKLHFRQHPAYIDLVELFHEVTLQTEVGQMCDLLTAPEDHIDLSQFSHDKTRFIMIYKTAYYSFYLPVALALHFLQLATPSNLQQSHDILIPLGVYFQVQDDYLDVYGSPEQIGKIGTDIQDNKCSWLINEALSLASPQQKATLQQNYGRKDKVCEAVVKQLFGDLQLQKRYADFEEQQVAKITASIQKVDQSQGLCKEVFEAFLQKIYRRSK